MDLNQQLSEDQIARLFEFVKEKNVPFIDVQFEIVDHLASAIEMHQKEDTELSFESALEQVYSGFPITGFGLIQIEKETYLKKYWRTRMIDYIKKFFIIPRIVISIITFLLIYFSMQMGGGYALIFFSILIYVGALITKYVNGRKSRNMYQYLIYKSYHNSVNFMLMLAFALPFAIIYLSIISEGIIYIPEAWASFYFTMSCIIIYASIEVFPKMLEKEIINKYAHLRLA